MHNNSYINNNNKYCYAEFSDDDNYILMRTKHYAMQFMFS